eukprot:symbB.v1.2.013507.t1/scaffold959.1/size148843/16
MPSEAKPRLPPPGPSSPRRRGPRSAGLVASGRASLRGGTDSRTDGERRDGCSRVTGATGRREDRGGSSSRGSSLSRSSGPPVPPWSHRNPAPRAERFERVQRTTVDTVDTDTQNDEDFALALLEQDLQEAEARTRERAEARAQRRANRRSMDEDELLAMMLAITQVQSEVQEVQAAFDVSRPEQHEAQLEEIQRQSLVEAIRAQLPVMRWCKDSYQGECALCLDEYASGDCVTRLTCLHAFHKACLDPWLDRNPSCPSCKCDLISAIK